MPVTTASCERTLSALRRVKTYLRSTMGQQRLNSLVIAAAHTEKLDTVDVRAVAEDFCCLNEARLKRYGSFRLQKKTDYSADI